MPIEVGAVAPDFTLKDQNNQLVTLSSYRDVKNVLLVFYPLAFTGTCQGELCRVRDELPTFENDDTDPGDLGGSASDPQDLGSRAGLHLSAAVRLLATR